MHFDPIQGGISFTLAEDLDDGVASIDIKVDLHAICRFGVHEPFWGRSLSRSNTLVTHRSPSYLVSK